MKAAWLTRAPSAGSTKSIDLESGGAAPPPHASTEGGSPGRIAWGEERDARVRHVEGRGADQQPAARRGDQRTNLSARGGGKRSGGIFGSLKRMLSGKGKVLDASPSEHGRGEPGASGWGSMDHELRSVAVASGETDASEQSTPVQHPSTPPRSGLMSSSSRAGGRGVGSLEAREWDERVAKKRGKESVAKASVSAIEVLQMAKYLGMVCFFVCPLCVLHCVSVARG